MIMSVAPLQWVILVLLVLLLIFDIQKRGEVLVDLIDARARKDEVETLVAATLVRMNLCDILGVGCFIGWIILRHEHILPYTTSFHHKMALVLFMVGLLLVLVKRWFEHNLRNKLRNIRTHSD